MTLMGIFKFLKFRRQCVIQAGELPPPEDNGVRYLKLPIDAL